MDVRQTYVDALARLAGFVDASELPTGLLVVADASRRGRRSATSYPLDGTTLLFADADLVPHLADLPRDRPLSTPQWLAIAGERGASRVGVGNQYVLGGALERPAADAAGLRFHVVDRTDPVDRERAIALVAACDADDVAASELDPDDLDPFSAFLLTDDGEVAAWTGAIPWDHDAGFDDIGVLRHPAFRGRRLGARVVHDFVAWRRATAPTRRFLYRCSEENLGSRAIAEGQGFTLLHQIGAMRFP